MLSQSDRRQITAREIEERHSEKLLALGPVLETINQDFLDPLIENAFLIMDRRGILPEVPEELQDQEYSIEYISVMAQAQKLAGIGSIERFVGFVGQVGSIDPVAVQKMNTEAIIENYAEHVGIDPSLIKTKEEMEELLAEQAEQQAQEQENIETQESINSAKTLSETNMNEDSALSELLGGVDA